MSHNKSMCRNCRGLLVETMSFTENEFLDFFTIWHVSEMWSFEKSIFCNSITSSFLASFSISRMLAWQTFVCHSYVSSVVDTRQICSPLFFYKINTFSLLPCRRYFLEESFIKHRFFWKYTSKHESHSLMILQYCIWVLH